MMTMMNGRELKIMENLDNIWDMFKERYRVHNQKYYKARFGCLIRIFYEFPREEIDFWILKRFIEKMTDENEKYRRYVISTPT